MGHRGADAFPEHFRAAHVALFAARPTTVRSSRKSPSSAAIGSSSRPRCVAASPSGRPLATLAAEHTEAVKKYAMFSVPTFVVGERAAFAIDGARPAGRHRPLARAVRFERLNELKYRASPGNRREMRVRMSDTEAVMWAVEKDPRSIRLQPHDPRSAPDEKRLRDGRSGAGRDPTARLARGAAPLRPSAQIAADPSLDLDYHVRRIAVPAPGDTRSVLDVCEQCGGSLDRSRPLWDKFTMIDGLAGGRAALLQKIHHTISDGVGGLKLSLALLDLEPDPPPQEEPWGSGDPVRQGSSGPVEALRPSPATRRNIGRCAGSSAGPRCARAAGAALAGARSAPCASRSVGRQGRRRNRALGSRRARSLRRRFEVYSVPLPALKDAANALGGSVNGAYVLRCAPASVGTTSAAAARSPNCAWPCP